MQILAYGTLKENDYNFHRIRAIFGDKAIVKTGEKVLNGYKMYDLGYYPAIRKSNTEEEIHVQIMEVSPEAARFINTMELGAGYSIEEVEGARLYVYGHQLDGHEVIEGGNWTARM